MQNTGSFTAILGDIPEQKETKKLEVDEEKARTIYEDLEKLWTLLVNTEDTQTLYSKYMSIVERFKEDVLNDR